MWWNRWGEELFAYARGLLGRRADAEDTVSQVFLALAQRSSDRAPIENPRAYLYTAVRHQALRVPRDSEQPLPLDEDRWVEPRGTNSVEEALDLERELAALPQEQREVVLLKVFQRWTFAEIAELTETSPNTVASRFRYGIQRLRAQREEAGR